jgi:uncharacterized protein DUF4129
MITWQRLLYILCLAVVEATPAALPLVLAGAPGTWGLLIVVVLAGALADWLAAGWLPVERQQPALLGAALLFAAWAIKVVVGGGGGLLSGWDQAFGALFSLTNARGGLAYLTLLICLYAFRRGTRLLDHDSISLRGLFARASVALILILGFVSLATLQPNDARLTLTTIMLLAFFAVGLLAIALASAAEEHDTQLSRLGWRGTLTLLAAIGLVLVLGLLFASVFGQDAARSVRAIVQGVLLLIVLIILPFLLLLEGLLEQIARMVNLRDFLRVLEQRQLGLQRQQAQATEVLSIFPPWVRDVMQVLLALLPVLIIVALYLLVRRRARREPSRDEERESLWSWSGLASDIRDLLAGLRRAQEDSGLRAALARLRAGDPISRIRRSYIRLLLAGEAHERPRAAPETPREYAPEARALLPAAGAPIDTLTDAYERARYHPSSVSPADADAAERAWSEADAAERRP